MNTIMVKQFSLGYPHVCFLRAWSFGNDNYWIADVHFIDPMRQFKKELPPFMYPAS